MEEIKKIIAKAVYGKGAKAFNRDIYIDTYERKMPAEILGIGITNTEIVSCAFEGNLENGKTVRVKGTFDVHLWYALNGDTKVAKVGMKFSDIIIVYGKEPEKYNNEEVRAWFQKTPKCSSTAIIDGPERYGVKTMAEYELGAEIVGQTELNVKVFYTVDASEEIEEIPMEYGETPDEFEDD